MAQTRQLYAPSHGPVWKTMSSIAMSLLSEGPLTASNIICQKKRERKRKRWRQIEQ